MKETHEGDADLLQSSNDESEDDIENREYIILLTIQTVHSMIFYFRSREMCCLFEMLPECFV